MKAQTDKQRIAELERRVAELEAFVAGMRAVQMRPVLMPASPFLPPFTVPPTWTSCCSQPESPKQ